MLPAERRDSDAPLEASTISTETSARSVRVKRASEALPSLIESPVTSAPRVHRRMPLASDHSSTDRPLALATRCTWLPLR